MNKIFLSLKFRLSFLCIMFFLNFSICSFATEMGPFKKIEITEEAIENVKLEKGSQVFLSQLIRGIEKTDGPIIFQVALLCSSNEKRAKPFCKLVNINGGVNRVSVPKSTNPPSTTGLKK